MFFVIHQVYRYPFINYDSPRLSELVEIKRCKSHRNHESNRANGPVYGRGWDTVVLFHLQRDENEQQSLKPLERKIIFEYGLDEFAVCTDGRLGSPGNRSFNDRFGQKFITTQSLKKLKEFLKEFALGRDGWQLVGCDKTYHLDEIDEEIFKDTAFYKDRIMAHFQTCFLALIVFKILQQKLNHRFISEEIIATLRDMNMKIVPGQGFVPLYTRTDLTNALHDAFGVRTDRQIVPTAQMKSICTKTKRDSAGNITTALRLEKQPFSGFFTPESGCFFLSNCQFYDYIML